MAKNFKLIKGVNDAPLKKLNEGEAIKNPDKYIFQGVFTQCSTPEHKVVNRNGRIYMEKEMLRHLGYLREQIKENNGKLPGELDHPEGRFDISLKEASHMITDLWYDDNTKCVMGRLEVLDTENGMKLRSIIDAGYPLYVSSRAAGDVNERTKEVEIAQIFTYDVVCTPGFKEAKLERVNESLLSDKALKYINESLSDAANVEDKEIPATVVNEALVAEFNNTTIEDVTSRLLEQEEPGLPANLLQVQDMSASSKVNAGQGNALKEEDDAEEKPEEPKEEEKTEEDKEETSEEPKDEEEKSEEPKEEDKEEDKAELSDEEKEENKANILNIVGIDADGEVVGDDTVEEDELDDSDILDIAAAEDEEPEAESDEDEAEEDKESTEEKEETDVDGSDEPTEESEENEATRHQAELTKEKASKIKVDTDSVIANVEEILASVKKAEDVKESIIRRYPFAAALTESNFAKFASLRPKLKKRVVEFIEENEIYSYKSINELWTTPLREDKKMQQNWLRLAAQSDIDLYVAAPVDVQNAIEESAKYVILETAEDVDMFWQRTGLRQAAARKLMNEKMIQEYQSKINESREFQAQNPLGYNADFIRMTEQWFENN